MDACQFLQLSIELFINIICYKLTDVKYEMHYHICVLSIQTNIS
jgi:hypothetical protein